MLGYNVGFLVAKPILVNSVDAPSSLSGLAAAGATFASLISSVSRRRVNVAVAALDQGAGFATHLPTFPEAEAAVGTFSATQQLSQRRSCLRGATVRYLKLAPKTPVPSQLAEAISRRAGCRPRLARSVPERGEVPSHDRALGFSATGLPKATRSVIGALPIQATALLVCGLSDALTWDPHS
jgi:hypothetical protein